MTERRQLGFDPNDDYAGYDRSTPRPLVNAVGKVVGNYVRVNGGSNVVAHADGTPGSDGLRDALVELYGTREQTAPEAELGSPEQE